MISASIAAALFIHLASGEGWHMEPAKFTQLSRIGPDKVIEGFQPSFDGRIVIERYFVLDSKLFERVGGVGVQTSDGVVRHGVDFRFWRGRAGVFGQYAGSSPWWLRYRIQTRVGSGGGGFRIGPALPEEKVSGNEQISMVDRAFGEKFFTEDSESFVRVEVSLKKVRVDPRNVLVRSFFRKRSRVIAANGGVVDKQTGWSEVPPSVERLPLSIYPGIVALRVPGERNLWTISVEQLKHIDREQQSMWALCVPKNADPSCLADSLLGWYYEACGSVPVPPTLEFQGKVVPKQSGSKITPWGRMSWETRGALSGWYLPKGQRFLPRVFRTANAPLVDDFWPNPPKGVP